jgi:hypothetical protein
MRRSTVYYKEGKHCFVAAHQELKYPMTCEFQLLISAVVTLCLRKEMKFSLSASQAGLLEAEVYLVFFLNIVTYFMT